MSLADIFTYERKWSLSKESDILNASTYMIALKVVSSQSFILSAILNMRDNYGEFPIGSAKRNASYEPETFYNMHMI